MADTYWSHDHETFDSPSLKDLLTRHQGLRPGDLVQYGLAQPVTASDLSLVDNILEDLNDLAYDLVGEIAGNYPDVSQEAKEELGTLLASWIEKHCPPNFYRVVDITGHTLTKEDFEEVGLL